MPTTTPQNTFSNLANNFRNWLIKQKLSPNSVKNYLTDLNKFLSWYQNLPLLQRKFENQVFENYRLFLLKSKAPITTANRFLSSLRRFGQYLQTHNIVTDNPAADLKNLTPEEIQTPPPSQTMFDQFTKAIAKENLSTATIKNYLGDVQQFFLWLEQYESGIDLQQFNVGIVKKYKKYLKTDLRLAPASIERKISSLRRFFTWAVKENLLLNDPFAQKKVLPTPPPILPISLPVKRQEPFLKPKSEFDWEKLKGYWPYGLAALGLLLLLFLLITKPWQDLFPEMPVQQPVTPERKEKISLFPSPTPKTAAIATTLLSNPWIINFSGKLTSQTGKQISQAANIVFSVYDQAVGGIPLWTSKEWPLSPDKQGNFSAPLGDTTRGDKEIPARLFFVNDNLFLGTSIEGNQLSPRQPVSTAANAANAYLLQKHPPQVEASASAIPILDENGTLTLAAQAPKIKALNDTFALEGQAITITTPFASDGDITLAPDGAGTVKLYASNQSDDSLTITNANLITGSLISASLANNLTIPYLLNLKAGGVPETKFSVDPAGNLYLTGTLTGETDLVLADSRAQAPLTDSSNTALPGGASSIFEALNFAYNKPSSTSTSSALWTDGGDYLYPASFEDIRIYDSTQTDYINISHNSNAAEMTESGTANFGFNLAVIMKKNLNIEGQTTIGNDSGDATIVNSASWTFSNDTNFALSGGINGLSFDTSTLSIDATNNRVGIGTTSPGTLLELSSTAPYLTLWNTTEEDGDYGRKSKLIFEGEQTGGELTSLGEIELAHDGTSDDEKGIMTFRVNDGDDGSSPSDVLTIDSAGNVGIGTTGPTQKLHVEGQCVAGDTEIFTVPVNSSRFEVEGKQIKDIKKEDYVYGLNEKTSQVEAFKVQALLDMGIQPVFRLKTKDGKTIETTGNHPYLSIKQTPEGINKETYKAATATGAEISPERNLDGAKAVWVDGLTTTSFRGLRGGASLGEFNSNINQGDSDHTQNNGNLGPNGKISDQKLQVLNIHRSPVLSNINAINKNIVPKTTLAVNNHKFSSAGVTAVEINEKAANSVNSPDKTLASQAFTNSSITYLQKAQWTKVIYLEPGNLIAAAASQGNTSEAPICIGAECPELVKGLLRGEGIGEQVAWVEIESIEYVGKKQVYDIAVEGNRNFFGNGILAHNTYLSSNLGIGTTSPGTLLELSSTAPYLTLWNTTQEDEDYGRESKLIFEGEQSGGELTSLGEIELAHDGTSDDQKGIMTLRVNDGDDGASPSDVLTIDSSGQVGIGQTSPAAKLEVEIGSADAVTGLLVDQDDLDQTGLQIVQAADATANALDISSLQISGNVLDIDWSAAETQADAALAGIALDFTNLTPDDNKALYGLHINDQASAGAGSLEYAIYQQGTNWDYGLYVEDQCVTGDTLLPVVAEEISNYSNCSNCSNQAPSTNKENPKKLDIGHFDIGNSLGQLEIRSIRNLEYIPIKDIQPNMKALSLDEETGKIVPAKIKALLDMGVKPVYKLTTEDGRTIRTTANHPYLTKDGWKKVAYLHPGMEIAVANRNLTDSRLARPGSFGSFGGNRIKNQDQEKNNHRQTKSNLDISINSSEITHSSPLFSNQLATNKQNIARTTSLVKTNLFESSDKSEKLGRIKTAPAQPAAMSVKNPEKTLAQDLLNTFFIKNNNITRDSSLSTDILWEPIVSIEYVGQEQVYDIEVEGTHNFIGGHFVKRKSEARNPKHETNSNVQNPNDQNSLENCDLEFNDCFEFRYSDFGFEKDEVFFGGIIAHNTYLGGAVTNAGDITLNKADPSVIFDVATATDTDFWLGVQDDAGLDDDDLFQIGDGTTPGTNPFLTIDTSGQVGINDTGPDAMLDIVSSGGGSVPIRIEHATSPSVDYLQIASNGSSGGDILTIDSTGQVGIGTTAPEDLLEIQGAEATDAILTLDADDGDDAADTWEIRSEATGNDLSIRNADAEVFNLTTGGDLQLDGDLTISGDDLYMGTNTTGYILVADNTNFNPVDMSGDVDIDSAGATTIQANSVALGTDTTGNYVGDVAAGSGIGVSGTPGEGYTETVALGNLTADWSQGGAYDVALANASSELKIMESVGGTYYGILDVTDLGADRTYTFPNQSGTVAMTSDIPTSDNYQYWYLYVNNAAADTISSTELLDFNSSTGVDVSYDAVDDLSFSFDCSDVAGTNLSCSGETLNATDTNTTYSAGNDLDLSGTTFNIEPQLDYVTTISRASSNLTLQTTTSGDIILSPAGNVGIGTTAPLGQLEVTGNITGNAGYKTWNWSSGHDGLVIDTYYNSSDSNMRVTDIASLGNVDPGSEIRFLTTPYLGSTAVARMLIDNAGNVGIGTTDPGAILHLEDTGNEVELRIRELGSSDPIIRLAGETAVTNEGFTILYDNSVGDTYFNNIYASAANGMAFHFQVGGSDEVVIKNDGSVGIGETSPGAKVEIDTDVEDNVAGLLVDQDDTTNNPYGIEIQNAGTGHSIYDDSTAHLTAAGVWTDASSRKFKENFQELNNTEILGKINNLQLVEYNYIEEDDNIKHFGAMAEDWYASFRLGDDDKTISAKDAAMVALKGIQALSNEIFLTVNQLTTKLTSPLIETEELATALIRPISDDLSVQLNEVQGSRFKVQGSQGKEVASIDARGTGTFKELIAQNIKADNIETEEIAAATVSARIAKLNKVYADEIVAGKIKAGSIEELGVKIGEITSREIKTATIAAQTIINNYYPDAPDLPDNSDLSELEQELNELLAEYNAMDIATASGSYQLPATSYQLPATNLEVDTGLFNSYLAVLGSASIVNLDITSNMTVAHNLQFTSNSISTLGWDCTPEKTTPEVSVDFTSGVALCETLYLQPSGLGAINILAGAVTINNLGDLSISGSLHVAGKTTTKDLEVAQTATVSGSLFANLIRPVSGQSDISVQLDEVQGSRFKVQGSSGDTVASIDALGTFITEGDITSSGSAKFNKLLIASATSDVASAEATSSGTSFGQIFNPEITTNAAVGKAVLPAGQTELTINNQQLTNDSLVYITPQSDTENKVLYVKNKSISNQQSAINNQSYFTVAIDAPINKDIEFNWWLIN